MKFLIWAWDYGTDSGGGIALHRLAHNLVQLGQDRAIVDTDARIRGGVRTTMEDNMTKEKFDRFTEAIDGALGNLKMTWEGPEPHDFRNMKERGVRFIHTGLFTKLPDPFALETGEYAPDGKVQFQIAVGDDAAAEDIMRIVRVAGFDPTYFPSEEHALNGRVRFFALVA